MTMVRAARMLALSLLVTGCGGPAETDPAGPGVVREEGSAARASASRPSPTSAGIAEATAPGTPPTAERLARLDARSLALAQDPKVRAAMIATLESRRAAARILAEAGRAERIAMVRLGQCRVARGLAGSSPVMMDRVYVDARRDLAADPKAVERCEARPA